MWVSDWNLLRPTDSTDSHSCSRPKYPRRNWPKEGSDHHSTPTRLLQLLMPPHPPPPIPLWGSGRTSRGGEFIFGSSRGQTWKKGGESCWKLVRKSSALPLSPSHPQLPCPPLCSRVCVCVLFGHDNDCGEHGERYSLWCREERSWPQSCQGARPRRGDLRRAEFLRCGLRQVGAGLLTAVLCSWVRSLLQIWLIQQVHCGLQVLASLLWAMTSFFFW